MTSRAVAALALVLCACNSESSADAAIRDTPPQVSLVASASTVTAPGQVTLVAAAVDETGIEKVEFLEGERLLSGAGMRPYAHVLSFTAADNGTRTYTARAFDRTGNSTVSDPVRLTIDIQPGSGGDGGPPDGGTTDAGPPDAGPPDAGPPDTTAPVVTLMASANTITAAGPLRLTATATDAVGVAKVELWEGFTKVAETNERDADGGTYTFTVPLTSQQNGRRRYYARAFDEAINSGTSPLVTVIVAIPTPSAIRAVANSLGAAYVLKEDGTVYSAGYGFYGATGGNNTQLFTRMFALNDVATLSSSGSNTYTLLAAQRDGTVVCLGNNMGGACGPTGGGIMPVTVAGVTGSVEVTTGGSSCSRSADGGTVQCWSAYNGNPAVTGTAVATVVFSDGGIFTGARRIQACNETVFAIRDDGTLWGWGRNDSTGLLGTATGVFQAQLTPARVVFAGNAPVSDVTDFDCGNSHRVFATSDGGLFAFGTANNAGQLGNTMAPAGAQGAAIPVTGLSGVTDIACGTLHTLVVDTDGDVWAWGSNAQGQLGTGSTGTGGAAAVQVTGLSNVVRVHATENTSFALTASGELYAWGAAAPSGINDGGATLTRPRLVAVP